LIHIAASLLSADMAKLAEAVKLVTGEVDYIHCDVMDGHFVPNLTFGAPVVAAIKRVSSIPLDVHLMIEAPGRWLNDYIKAGLDERDFLTFHYEAEPDPVSVIARIRSAGIKPGISIKPGTPFEEVAELVGSVDQVLVMTVEPGFGGQHFMHGMLPKIESARTTAGQSKVVAVDGGIDPQTAPLVVRAGADLLVAGNAIFRRGDPVRAVRDLREAISNLL